MRTGFSILPLALASLLVSCSNADNPSSAIEAELQSILSRLQKPPIETESYQEAGGWADVKNIETLTAFISKYPDTEESLLAETWLIFAQQNDANLIRDTAEAQRRRVERAARLKAIIAQTTKPGTAKIAMIQRTGELSGAEDFAELEKQIKEIIARINEFKAEKDKQFSIYLKLNETPVSALEPSMHHSLIIMECHQDRLKEALARAQKLQQDFPGWSRRENIQGVIGRLQSGKSPYPRYPRQFEQ